MTVEEPEGVKAFAAVNAFYVSMLGIGVVSPTITELLPEESRPAFCVGSGGWRGDKWGEHEDEQWIASWKTLAGLHGLLDALRLELPDELRREYAQLRRDAVPQGRTNLAYVAEMFRRGAGAG